MKIYLKLFLLTLAAVITGCDRQADFTPLLAGQASLESENTPALRPSHKTALERKRDAVELREIYSKPPEQWPKPLIDPGVELREIGSLPPVKFPPDNQFSVARAQLGRALFFDKRLSGSNALSCSTCHNPNQNWADGKELPTGHLGIQLKRHSPTILNNGYNNIFFWDGRANSLEAQAVAVITNPNEMHMTPETVEQTLNNIPAYQKKFKETYGIDRVDFNSVTKAIATFERTITTKNQSPFDQFLAGKKEALSDAAVRGLNIYRTQARCLNCHNGANFTDNKFHNLSLTYAGSDKEDLGRFNITKDPSDWGVFKTPTLRNAAQTGPYMHNGVFATISKLMGLYNDGMHGKDQNKSPLLHPLGLSDDDLLDLEAFINSLSEASPN
jgi:cytochrome c peroxidase